MAYDVKFLRGSATSYQNLATKDDKTFYYITDKGAEQLYLGSLKITDYKELAAAVSRIAENEADILKIQQDLAGLTGEAVTALTGRVTTLEGKVSVLEETSATKTELETAVSGEKTRAEGKELELSNRIKAIEDDHLEEEDKTELDGKITGVDNKVNTLIGTDTGKSVRTIANEELAAQLIPENAAEALDSLKEIADWIQAHPGDASALNTAIQNLQALVGELPAELPTDVDTVVKYINHLIAGEVSARDAAILVETNRAKSVEEGLTEKVQALETSVGTGGSVDSKIAAAVKTETDRATAAEEALNTALEGVKTQVGTGKVDDKLTALENSLKSYAEGQADTAKNGAIESANSYTRDQIATITLAEGSENGTVKFKGTDVPVHGLGSAAYTDAGAYEVAGAATTALSEAKSYAEGQASAAQAAAISAAAADAKNKADAAEANAINYTDSALTWGTIA
jgi:hypothetical protein